MTSIGLTSISFRQPTLGKVRRFLVGLISDRREDKSKLYIRNRKGPLGITRGLFAYIRCMKFLKIQAAGNDYLYVSGDTPLSDLHSLAEKYCDRRFGVGADGIIRVEKISDGLLSMRIFNADGSEGKTCGNGIRSSAVFA